MKIPILPKKAFFIFLISFLFIQSLGFAQPPQTLRRRQVVSIGPKIGVNLSDLNGDVNNHSLQPGISAGAMLTYSVVNTFGISVEALYSQKGAKFKNTAYNGASNNFNRRLNYIEVPVLARYFLNKSGDFRPNLFIGPDFGFKLNAKDVNRKITNGADQPNQDVSEAITPVDVGITAGIGLNFAVVEKMRFLIDARYTYGFSDIADETLPGFDNNGKASNSAISFTFGVSFGIGKKYVK
jgi:hypothetical protein